MNLTSIASIPSKSNWKRTIKGQYVAAVAGVALAVSAVIAGSSIERSRDTMPQQAAAALVQRQVSQADIDAAVLSSEMAHYGAPVAAAQPADVEHYGMGQTPLLVAPPATEADIAASVLSTELATYAVPAPVAKASDADIMAGVISSERAHFGN